MSDCIQDMLNNENMRKEVMMKNSIDIKKEKPETSRGKMWRRVYLFILFLFLNGCILQWPFDTFERNKDLSQITYMEDWIGFFVPKYDENRDRLYYLVSEGIYDDLNIIIFDEGGYLYCMDSFDYSTQRRLPIKGQEKFCSFDISDNGDTIVLATGNASEGGRIVMADISSDSIILDTIETSQEHIVWVKFSNNGDKIYYATIDEPSGYYVINIDGTGEELVEGADSVMPFDLTKDDSIISGVYPAVNPVDDRYVVMVYPPESYGRSSEIKKTDLILIDREEGDTTFLNAMPYEESRLLYPSWMPDGSSVIFSCKAKVMTDPIMYGTGIWILNNIDLGK